MSEAQNARISVDALNERVLGTERAISDLSSAVGSMRQDMFTAISGLSNKMDAQRDAALAAAKVSWWPIISGLSALAALVVVVGGLSLEPIKDTQTEQKQINRDLTAAITPLLAFAAQHERDSEEFHRLEYADRQLDQDKYSKDAQIEFEKRLDNRLSQGRDDNTARLAAIDHRIDTLAADQVSRAEHQSHWTETTARLDALSVRVNETEKEFARQISELRTQAPPLALPLAH